MQDIELNKTDDNTYDWTFNATDLQTVQGNRQLHTACIHAVLLKPNELLQEIYNDKGCTAHDMIRASATYTNKVFIEESIITSCKDLYGVYDATCTVELDSENGIGITELTLITSQGEEVLINDF